MSFSYRSLSCYDQSDKYIIGKEYEQKVKNTFNRVNVNLTCLKATTTLPGVSWSCDLRRWRVVKRVALRSVDSEINLAVGRGRISYNTRGALDGYPDGIVLRSRIIAHRRCRIRLNTDVIAGRCIAADNGIQTGRDADAA